MSGIAFRREAGSVLVVTLLVTILLATLAMSFSDETVVELSLSGFSRDNDMAYLAARSGVQAALAAMSTDKEKDVDSLKEDWATVGTSFNPADLLEEASVSVSVMDESGKLNLNMLQNSRGDVDEEKSRQVKRLFRVLGLGEEKAEPLLDWLDGDDIERMQGAESDYYRGLEQPYSCANGTFQTMDQLSLVKGLRPQDQDPNRPAVDLTAFLTVYTDGRININTAPSQVLQCLSDHVDASVAEAIIDYRKTEEFRNVSDLAKVPGLKTDILSGVTTMLTVKSSALTIEGRGTYRDASCTVRAVAVKEGQGDRTKVRLIYWQVK